jgi:NAD(P)-dependent dehydrogenase (short-subunit alcohol dehydrogenase family)
MASDASVDAAIQRVIDISGRLHTLANAGGPSVIFKHMGDFTAKEVNDFTAEDAGGIFRLIQRSLPHLRAGGGGSITVCTTMALTRLIKYDGLSAYSKGAVEGLIHQLAEEEKRHKIRCNTVPIGWIADENAADFKKMAESVRATRPNLAELVDQLREMIDEPGKPDEAGNLFAFLASNEARYITGQKIMIDGGATL